VSFMSLCQERVVGGDKPLPPPVFKVDRNAGPS